MAMFANKDSKKEVENASQFSTIIAKGTLIHGDIESSGNIRIEGKVVGNVKAKSKIAIGESGMVQGNILAVNAEVAGEVKGIIQISELMSVRPTGVINGDIIAQKLTVDTGGTLNGSTKMGVVTKEIVFESDETELSAKAV
jgi:cytoskeletal protein CcmA (bactofilin family)